MKSLSYLSVMFVFFSSIVHASSDDVLPSWLNNASKENILQFVERSLNPNAPDFIPVESRIAVFDVDGTLWVEKPHYAQQGFVLSEHSPALSSAQPKSEATLLTLSAKLFEGMSEKSYQEKSREFLLNGSLHPRYKAPHAKLIYQPMLELIRLLKKNKFDVYLCTGSDEGFVRSVAFELFGIPADHVIAQNVAYYRDDRSNAVLRSGEYRKPINLGQGKVSNIMHRIGKKPVLAVGNSLGDLQMLDWVADGGLSILITHDDAQREYDYGDKNQKIAKAFSAVNLTAVSMRKDFKNIFYEVN
ncbi:HAD family hydrolase [Pseudoteredinibacter isoporae]|uniref:Phosphoserine phosphatase n=1 Tax=Pseudoteredinibacter isoporae TaxID=570281 RepID=A0A7X0MU08_9GAMM|nr:HAD family hydrolase [Pseudoteredinibacter isoporae]MBB6519768.1 phosphoserine phosphatase [Pseudoteredinibacter isoporae]NHO85349.1 haloacid dehalogenase-like hydrolase [Pseudoteredinibacter isoporae]NIB26199.1 haloacid dehalogenase-like hydrolase [Pseudoteredinibacter isoporae]